MKYFHILLLMISGTISKKERPSKVHISGQVSPTATKQIQLKRDFLYGQQPLAGPLPVYVPPVTRWNSEIMRQERGDNRGFVAQRTARPSAQSIPSHPGVSSKVTQFHHRGAKKTQPRETNKLVLPDIINSTNGESHEGQANNFQKKSSTTKQRQNRHQSTSASDQSSAGNGGGGLGSILKGANVQGAVVEKGIEVMGKLVDKQLQIIDEAQEKAENFLKKEIKLDIVPDKSWQTDDMFIPAGYHMNSHISSEDSAPKEVGEPPYTYPAGVGNVLMNGCWGTGYQEGDPCYAARWKLEACLNLIDGAAFMGVGFDGRGEYSPESRKMSIVQRNCAGKATYDDYDVPDTMNVHGIYDTKASMVTFESRSEFQKYLQEEAGVSGSYFGFYAGVKAGWGESETQASQKYMALLHVDINRYEIFIDEVKPKDLSASFLKEFMALPTSYFAAGAPMKYLDFIQRWGTHYIKSAKFGGQLQIRKFMDASDVSSKKEFAREMEVEYKSLFASVGAKESRREGESSRQQAKTTSTTILAMGGSQQIASILSDAYSPAFKNEFKDWLASIPQYPKPFEFQMALVTTLLNFRLHDLFPEERSNWGCEGNAAKLKEEISANEDRLKFYETVDSNGTVQKYYCNFDSRKSLEEAITRRRISLTRAIEVYMKEGPNSITDIQLPPCSKDSQTKPGAAEPETTDQADEAVKHKKVVGLSWQHITKDKALFRVIFDMRNDLKGTKDFSDIPKNMSRLVRYKDGKWFTAEKDGSFHLYNAFRNGKSGDPQQHKISILGLVLSFNPNTGGLTLLSRDFEASRVFFPNLHDTLAGKELGRAVLDSSISESGASKRETLADPPCNVKWSNALRFDPTEAKGKCLHFTASSEGNIFVVFATLPIDKTSWYYIKITPQKVAIYKGLVLKTSTTNINARGLGDPNLLQSYFVCVTESESSTLIEYGKTLGTTQSGDVYLNMLDLEKPLNARFYAFGNGDKKADVIDAHIVARDQTKAECKGDTFIDLTTRLCTQECHEDCDPLYGCNTLSSGNPLPTECNVCRVAKDKNTGSCLPECPPEKFLTADKLCVDLSSTYDMEFQTEDNALRASVREIPELQALTLCFWIRLPQGYKTTRFAYPIIDYRTGSNRLETVTVYLSENHETKDIKLELTFIVGGGETLSVGVLSDQNWHQICISWAGHSGVTIQYLDGVRKVADTRHIGTLEGGGRLTVGHHTEYVYQITGLHLWDKVIPPEEIAEFATACEKGNGNVKTWADFYDLAVEEKIKINTPSNCRVSPSDAQ